MGGLVAHPVGAYLGFFGWKRLRVYQLPLWVDSRLLAFPVSSLAWYFFILLDEGTVRHRGTVRVKCPVEEHNRLTWLRFEPRPLDPLTPFSTEGSERKSVTVRKTAHWFPLIFARTCFFTRFLLTTSLELITKSLGNAGKFSFFLLFFSLFLSFL